MNGVNGYQKTRFDGSDVVTFECSKSQHEVFYVEDIKNKLQPLIEMVKSYPNAIMAVNGPFFNYDASSENCIKWGKSGTTAIYTKDKKLIFVNGSTLTAEQKKAYEGNSLWVVGLGCQLTENGVESIKNGIAGDPFNPNARTILHQLKDGSIMFSVVQGKMKACAGLKAIASINPFNKGMDAKQAAKYSVSVNSDKSVFCDGGGSSEMIVKINGKWVTVNKPTDGSSRHIGGCFIVVRRG